MALSQAPIKDDIAAQPMRQTWVKWFDAVYRTVTGAVADIVALKQSFGWYDYNDLGTHTTPQAVLSGVKTYLINDGAGVYSSNTYKVANIDSVYNSSTNAFDFSGLSIGDVVSIRVDTVIETTSPNQEVSLGVTLAIGTGIEYSIPFGSDIVYKSAKSYAAVFYNSFYIGNEETKNNPAKVYLQTDSNANIVMNGYFISVNKYRNY